MSASPVTSGDDPGIPFGQHRQTAGPTFGAGRTGNDAHGASAVGIGPHRPIAHPAAEVFTWLDVVGAEGTR